jgi:hypothetical protein
MVLFLLYVKAELENVASVKLRREANLCFDVKNPLSDFEVREKVVLNSSETLDQEENAREPPHHFSLKWEGSKKSSILTILDEKEAKTALKKKKGVKVPSSYDIDDSGNWGAILAVECRGLEPTAFFPMGDDFVIESKGGSMFTEDVELGEGDWADYDEENDGTLNIQWFCSCSLANRQGGTANILIVRNFAHRACIHVGN